MKFKDIPQFTHESPYTVNIAFKRLLNWIEEQKEELNLQLNPDFQRGYVWTEKQQVRYVEYLLRGGRSGRNLYFNHPNWGETYKGIFVCVDGLQRITACSRFLNNEFKVFGNYYEDFEDKLHSEPTLIININNLKTRKNVLTWYIEMNSGGTIHTEKELNRVKLLLKKENDK